MHYPRREFFKIAGAGTCAASFVAPTGTGIGRPAPSRKFNGSYRDLHLNRVAFPIGGIGAGMLCLEGTGAFSHFSLRNHPDIFNEPCTFAAVSIRGRSDSAKVLEGPVPGWKLFGVPGAAQGSKGSSYGFPRFEEAEFTARFPFCTVELKEKGFPLEVEITGWSPFIPGDADNSSLPVGGFEYRLKNISPEALELVFSYNATNFMAVGRTGNSIGRLQNGFVLHQDPGPESPQDRGDFGAFLLDDEAIVDHCWFRGDWFDSLTMAWKHIQEHRAIPRDPVEGPSPGASLFLPVKLRPGEERTVRLLFAWYVPKTNLRFLPRQEGDPPAKECPKDEPCCETRPTYVPWYAARFNSFSSLAEYWRENYSDLRKRSALFRDTFFDTDLPPEVIEAVAANLTILKSPAVLRQCDGRLWCFEGCGDTQGCCIGSCTHVWNYAQAIPHLFPDLERTLRETEFKVNQTESGHQAFRASLPIHQVSHDFHAAADGQLGGIMKVYREWRISGNTAWLRDLWPRTRASLDYCIRTWDPKQKGVIEEPHHNTYDIEFWGPDGMCTSFYLGALEAAIRMGEAMGDDVTRYRELLQKGIAYMEQKLFNGEYFAQEIKWEGLEAGDPVTQRKTLRTSYDSPEALELLRKEGPKYQYGDGCLSDGVLGFWMARMCGLGEIVDQEKVRKNLKAIHRYNLKHDLSQHSNPQRPTYACGDEGGLLLCTWPKGNAPSLPFVYSNEVWTGIEYQVASHLMLEGMVEEGLDIVRICRSRYDGTIRNPFDEYECGHWYGRALASYGLLQGLTGVRYDAVEKTLYIDPSIDGDFRAFLCTQTGYGTVGMKDGKPFWEIKSGKLEVARCLVSGVAVQL
ncbi:MAG: GH116 family glycosyl hydrolase [Acidobacteriota bacterium]